METRTYFAGTTRTVQEKQERGETVSVVTVEVTMPHVEAYGREKTMQLAYGAKFPVRIGQTVLCPPTRLNPKWTKGRVTAVDGGDYRGKLKYVAPLGRRRK